MTQQELATLKAAQDIINKNADREALRSYRNRQRVFDYHVGTQQYYNRFIPQFFSIIWLMPGAIAFGYLMLQAWAYSRTGIVYPSYAIPTIIVILVSLLAALVTTKVYARPTDRY